MMCVRSRPQQLQSRPLRNCEGAVLQNTLGQSSEARPKTRRRGAIWISDHAQAPSACTIESKLAEH